MCSSTQDIFGLMWVARKHFQACSIAHSLHAGLNLHACSTSACRDGSGLHAARMQSRIRLWFQQCVRGLSSCKMLHPEALIVPLRGCSPAEHCSCTNSCTIMYGNNKPMQGRLKEANRKNRA